jgi:uncharacterized membrane protein
MRINSTLRTPKTLLAFIIVIASAWLFAGAAFKYSRWGQGFDMVDFSMPFWATLRGRFLGISRFNFTDTFLGLDLALGFLPALPFFALLPSAYTLAAVQVLLLTTAAIPVYLIARERYRNEWAGLAWAAVYLLYPTTQFVALAGPFQPRVPGLVCVLWAFYFFERQRLVPHLLLLLLAMLSRTDAALIVIAFGLYAIVRRRNWRWWAIPILVGGVYFYAALTYLTPLFYDASFQPERVSVPFDLNRDYNDMWPCGVSPQACYYLHLGGSLPEIARNIITHPVEVFVFVFQPEKLRYLALMFGTLLLLPLFAPRELLIAAPIFAINLLSNRVYQYVITEQYQILVIPGMIIAGIYGGAWLLERFTQKIENREQRLPALYSLCCILIVLAVALWNIPLRNPVISVFRNAESAERVVIMEQMAAQIPADARVAATSFLAPHLLPRDPLYYIPPGKMHHQIDEAQYAFIDTRAQVLRGTGIVERLRSDPRWRVVDERDDLVLFTQIEQ